MALRYLVLGPLMIRTADGPLPVAGARPRLVLAVLLVERNRVVPSDRLAEELCANPCGPDGKAHVDAVKQFVDAGFTHVAVVQIGGEYQDMFFSWAEQELLPARRELA